MIVMYTGRTFSVAGGVFTVLFWGTIAPSFAQAPQQPVQQPTSTPELPKDSKPADKQTDTKKAEQQGLDPRTGFPKSTLKEPKPTKLVAPAQPGRIDTGKLQQQLQKPLTLQEAISYALTLQPNVAAAQASREASEQSLKASQSGYYPNVAPTYVYQNRYTGGGTTTQFVNGVPISVSNNNTTETKQGDITAAYTVFDSFNRELSNKQARQNLRAAKFAEEDTRQTVIANVAANYFTALRNAALVKVSQAQVERAQNTLDVVRAQVDAGVAAKKDTYQSEADLLNAQVSLLQAQNNAAIAQAQLKQSIGLVGSAPLQLADVPAPSDQTPVTALGTAAPALSIPDTDTLSALAEAAYKQRPDIARTEKQLEVSQTSVGMARVNNGLQATVTVSDGYTVVPKGDNKYTDTQNRQLNLNMSYPLFDGGLTRSQVRQAQANVRGSEANLDSLRQSVSVEVEQAWRTLTQARASLPAAESAQKAAQVNYDAAVESRREGVGSIVEIIQAQTSLVQAQQSLVQAIYDFYTADAALAKAVGLADKIAGIGQAAEAAAAAAAAAPAGTPTGGQTITPATPTPTQPATPVPTPVTPSNP